MDYSLLSVERAQWAERLVTFYFVDLDLLARSLSKANSQTGTQITALAIQHLMLRLIDGARPSGWHHVVSNKHYIGVPMFLRSYSKWASALGFALGFDCDGLDFEDDWAENSTPEIQAILLGLTDRLRSDLPAAKKLLDPSTRAQAFETMQLSTTRGEVSQQIQIRAEHAVQGLRRIK